MAHELECFGDITHRLETDKIAVMLRDLLAEVERLTDEVAVGEQHDCDAVDMIHKADQTIADLRATVAAQAAALKRARDMIEGLLPCSDNLGCTCSGRLFLAELDAALASQPKV
jgi:hypothetical protein